MLQFEEKDISEELINLSCLVNENNLEAIYKFVCLNNLLEDDYKEQEFKKLYERKYYRSYVDYALFLNSKNRNIEALKILMEAKNNGVLYAGFLYFDVYLDNYSLDILEQSKYTFSPKLFKNNNYIVKMTFNERRNKSIENKMKLLKKKDDEEKKFLEEMKKN